MQTNARPTTRMNDDRYDERYKCWSRSVLVCAFTVLPPNTHLKDEQKQSRTKRTSHQPQPLKVWASGCDTIWRSSSHFHEFVQVVKYHRSHKDFGFAFAEKTYGFTATIYYGSSIVNLFPFRFECGMICLQRWRWVLKFKWISIVVFFFLRMKFKMLAKIINASNKGISPLSSVKKNLNWRPASKLITIFKCDWVNLSGGQKVSAG